MGSFCLFQMSAAPAWCADHSRKELPIEFEDEPRMNTNRHEYRWTSFAATPSRNEAHPGARASRPHAPPSRAAQYVYDVAAGHPVGRNRIVPAPLPIETGGGGWRGCARTCAGGTPALPGGLPLSMGLAARGGVPRLAGPHPCGWGRAVKLGGPSSFFVSLRGSLFFRLFPMSGLPGRPPPLVAIAGSHAKMLIRKGYRRP